MGRIKPHSTLFFLTLGFGFFFTNCGHKPFYQKSEIFNGKWLKNKELNFSFTIKDTVSSYQIYLDLTNNNDYPFSNIYLFSKFASPNKSEMIDTTEYYLAMPNGDWIGNNNGQSYSRKLLFRDKFKFNQQGTYHIKLIQAMRKDTLVGIEKVGIIIDQTTP